MGNPVYLSEHRWSPRIAKGKLEGGNACRAQLEGARIAIQWHPSASFVREVVRFAELKEALGHAEPEGFVGGLSSELAKGWWGLCPSLHHCPFLAYGQWYRHPLLPFKIGRRRGALSLQKLKVLTRIQ